MAAYAVAVGQALARIRREKPLKGVAEEHRLRFDTHHHHVRGTG